MYRISKQFEFSAGHWVEGLPLTHPCSEQHGHNYIVELILESEDLDGPGFVVDYRALAQFKTMIDATIDHKTLNHVLDFNPTAENLARYFYDWARMRWPQVAAARVSETSKTWAEYRP